MILSRNFFQSFHFFSVSNIKIIKMRIIIIFLFALVECKYFLVDFTFFSFQYDFHSILVICFFRTEKVKLSFNHRSAFLTNYWPSNSHIQNVIGGAHLIKGYKVGLTQDRFGRPLSALSFNTGHYELPLINYFTSGQFTITAWVNLRAYNYFSRLFELCDGPQVNSIGFVFYAVNEQHTTLFLNSG